MTTTIILVRHGETEWNRIERFRGRIDVALNATGIQQAQLTAHYIHAHWQPAAVYSSPLSRAAATAQPIAELTGLSVVTEPNLADTNYGDWQGLTATEVAAHWPGSMTTWRQAPHTVTIPGGEALADVRARAMAAVNRLVLPHEGATIVVVSHTDVIRLIVLAVLGVGNDGFWRLRQDNCAINLIDAASGSYILRSMNCTFHLIA